MKGIVLAGGLGTRLYPLTYATNKHLLPVFDRPMIYYPIQTLLRAGIKDIMVVTGGPHAGHFISVLKNGKDLGIHHLEFAFQEAVQISGRKIEGGIAHALSLCEDFSCGEPVTVILGDNTTDSDITSAIKSFKNGAKVFLKKVSDPERFGVPVFDHIEKNKILAIEEKPKRPKSSFAVVGLYIYDNQVFDCIRQIQPSERGELEITDVNNWYLKNSSLSWAELNGFWTDAGTFESLFRANEHWAKKKGSTK